MPSKATYDLTLKISTDAADFKKSSEEIKRNLENIQKSSSDQAAKIKSNFLTVVGVLGTLKGTLETVKTGMNETGEGADNLEKFTVKLREGFESLAKSIIQADFSNMINNWKNASKAAGEYADSMDLVDDRLKDLSVKRATVTSSVSMLRAKQAEGTLTKSEASELKKGTEDLLKIEQDIYNAAIKAQIKFIADKNSLNSELFSTLENGINQRVSMNEEELNGLQDYVDAYKKFKDETIKVNTELVQTQTTGGGIMGNAGSTTTYVNMEKVNKALEEYISKQSDVAKLQIFQQQLAGSEDYDKLIEFFIKRNNLEGEYAGLLRKTLSAETKGSTTAPSPITRVQGVSKVSTSNLTIPTLANLDPTTLAKPAKTFKTSWVDSLTTVNENIQTVGNSFQGLADVINQSSEDGKISFGESMKIIQEAAMSTASILGALAAAQMISKEASKGLIGIATAVAGLAMLGNLWSSFVTPDRYENGTGYASGGWSVVGETGPERMYVPRGARILNSGQSRNSFGIDNNQEVRLRLVGTDLVGSFKVQNRLNKSYA